MTTPDLAFSEVQKLVQRFKSLPAAERKGMNENATRQGYILPLFRALGWNVDNVNEVSPEEKVSRGWVDYSFRIGGIPRFFLETKKASEDLNDPRWVQQAIDYAWTKSVTWALLSDFEGLRVFNAEWKETDPFRAQFLEFNLESYLTDFQRLWWFSREETLTGRLEREADKVGKRIKRLPVSLNLFDDLKLWRSELYQSLRGYNPLFSLAQIDEAVLRLLNRLIFIRTAEDRDVEPMRLMPLLRELEDRRQLDKLSEKLAELFRQFDATYNSELFAPHFSEELYCDRLPLEALIRGLYEKNFVRYNFNALEADVLGTAYEQYLGHVVTEVQSETGLLAAASHVDEKRAKRKSQGIYYTPAFVTRYIVQQTVSRWLDEHGYNPSTPPRILDMACGSGSFLIEAFDTLDRFVAKQRNQAHGESDDLHDNLRRLELLTSCIFGVDKDKQAVDVARLNLMLRALHGRQKMPLLTNIYHADSLRPETWQAFAQTSEVLKTSEVSGGMFDIIIGNPPYVRPRNLPTKTKEYLWQHFSTFVAKSDLYCCFIEQAIKLVKPSGLVGFVVSDGWLRLDSFQAIRQYILANCQIVTLVDLPDKVFEDAMVKTGIFVFQKCQLPGQRAANAIQIMELSIGEKTPSLLYEIRQDTFEHTPRNVFDLSLSAETSGFKHRIESSNPKLGELADIRFGLKTGDDSKFIQTKPLSKQHRPLLRGENVHRYITEFAGEYVWYVPDEMREHRKTARPGEPERFEQPKILVRDTGEKFECTLDTENYYVKDVLIVTKKTSCTYSLYYITGLLNSKLLRYYYETSFPTLHVQNSELSIIPIRRINFADPAEKSAHDEIVKMVEEMLALQKQRQQAEAAKEDARFALQKRIQALDEEIDARVYRLYRLTEEEIGIVEKNG